MISNRKQIENFCNDRNIKIHSLEYIRNHEYIYGDSFDSSYWELSIFLTESTISTYDTTLGDTKATLPKYETGAIGDGDVFIFRPTGLGDIVTATYMDEYKIDLTEDNW